MNNFIKMAILVITIVFLIILVLSLIPTSYRSSKEHKSQKYSYKDSQENIKNRIKDENEIVCDKCHTIFLDHGQKTDKVYVLIHGITNSPVTWKEFGQRLYENGSNVYIPRMPKHGLKSLKVNELKKI